MGNQPGQPGHPAANMVSKYWWLSLPVIAVVGARAVQRNKKGNKWHEQAFQVASDLGTISFPITAAIMVYEFGVTQQQIKQLQQQQAGA